MNPIDALAKEQKEKTTGETKMDKEEFLLSGASIIASGLVGKTEYENRRGFASCSREYTSYVRASCREVEICKQLGVSTSSGGRTI